MHPPQLNQYQLTHSVTLRFTANAAAVNTAITFADLLDTILMATTAIAPFDVFDLVRVRKVEVWGQAALGTPSTVQVVFSANGDNNFHTDTSLGIQPAYVSAKPSSLSLASFFTGPSGTSAFLLSCPAGSVIDVSLTFRDNLSVAAGTAAQVASVGASVGAIFYRGLDGIAAAGTNFPVPAGIPSF